MTKKSSLLLVSLFVVLGLATSAFAQTQWTVGANENDGGRAQGLTESTGQVTLSTTSSGTVGSGTYFRVFYTAPISDPNSVYVVCSGSSSPQSPFGVGGLWNGPNCAGLFTKQIDTTAKQLTIIFNKSVPFPTGSSSQISITVRVNATGAPCGGEGTVGAGVFAIVDAHTPQGAPNLTITPFQPSSSLRVLLVHCDPALSVGVYDSTGKLLGLGYYYKELDQETDVIICLGVLDKSYDEYYENHFVVNVDEEFDFALTSESYENLLDPGTPADVTNGTLITVTINHIPKGFGIKAEPPIPCSASSANPLYCPGGTLEVGPAESPDWFEGDGVTTSVTFQYPIITVDNASAENVNLPFKFWSKGPLGTSGLPDVTVSVQKDPNPVDDPNCGSCIPRFKYVVEGSLDVIDFDNCVTNLLWPFITVNGSWDSAIAISNTSWDQLASSNNPLIYNNPLLVKGSAVPNYVSAEGVGGNCDLAWFANGKLVVEWQSPVIAPGATWGVDMSTMAPSAAFGGNGYVYGVCFFSNAHGYAYIVNNYGAPTSMFGNYLALVIPDPEWIHRGTNGDGLGEGATTPLNINRKLLKLIFYGSI